MRHVKAFVMAVSASALIAACDQQTPSTPAADPAAAAAEREAAVAQALEARLAEATKVHESSGPLVYFANLKDGDAVASPFRVVFGLHGMGVAPALVEKENTGHHHLLIDTELSEEEMQYAIPNDAQHLHFGGGQTETVLQLPAGQHTLQLVFGDFNHELHKPTPLMSEKITITVK